MRHKKHFNHLGRTSSHRKAMLSNMASSLIEHKRITTTLAKAKALKMYVEPLITKSKDDTTHSRRTVFSYLQNKVAVSELFREVGPKVASRNGGYTRIIKMGPRLGDNAEMCLIELVDFNELYSNEKKTKKASRSRRGSAKKAAAPKQEAPKAESKPVEEPKAEAEVAAEAAPAEEAKAEAKSEAPKAEEKKTEIEEGDEKKEG